MKGIIHNLLSSIKCGFKKVPFIILLTLIICCSCKKDENTTNAKKIVAEWIGKTIVFPPDITYTSLGRDTVCPDLPATSYKILVYTDSTGCTSCKLQLYKWKNLMEEANAEVGSRLSFHFYFHPKDERELKFLLKRDDFISPVCIDKEDRVNKLNKFPSDMNYQCFLLDKDNKVLLVGNPVLNPAVWKLYKQVITGEENDKTLIKTTYVEAKQEEIELQDLKIGQVSKAVFILKNTGDAPLVIQDITTSCGCTAPKWNKEPVVPGEETEIEVNVIPENIGHLRETITVFCNTEAGRLFLTVKGTLNNYICPKLNTSPSDY